MTITLEFQFENEEFSFTETIDTGTAVQQPPSVQPIAQGCVKATYDESTAPASLKGGGSGVQDPLPGTGLPAGGASPITIVGPFIFMRPRKTPEKES